MPHSLTASEDFRALMDAIRAHPHDDTPRLVFADFLDENGAPARGEFVRVQCRIAATENYPGERFCAEANGLLRVGVPDCETCEPCRLRRRERELWNIITATLELPQEIMGQAFMWTAPEMKNANYGFAWHRGFLSRVRCSWKMWSRHGDAILADPWVPGLDEVELTTWPDFHGVDSSLDSRFTFRALQARWPAVRSWTLSPEPVIAT